MNRSVPLVGAAILSIVMLSGCVTSVTTPVPSASQTADVASPSPTPTPTLAAEPSKPDLSSLVITPAGLGPLVFGTRPPVGDPATDVVVFDPEFCPPDYAEVGPRGVWVTNYPDEVILQPSEYAQEQRGSPFRMITDNTGAITLIEVRSSTIRTDAGIHTGSTRQAVMAAYPDAEVAEWGDRGSIFSVPGSRGRLVFELVGSDASVLYPIDTVYMIRVEQMAGTPTPYQGTDRGIYPCSRA